MPIIILSTKIIIKFTIKDVPIAQIYIHALGALFYFKKPEQP